MSAIFDRANNITLNRNSNTLSAISNSGFARTQGEQSPASRRPAPQGGSIIQRYLSTVRLI